MCERVDTFSRTGARTRSQSDNVPAEGETDTLRAGRAVFVIPSCPTISSLINITWSESFVSFRQ